ncbi:MAG: winged helix-turn-helix domain-containing protein [Gammaproteobacteria bacterium]
MGIKGQEKELWRALFSRTRRRVIGLLFSQPGRTFYANEIVRSVAVGTGSVQRELTRLAEAGLLSVRRIGNQVHYQANSDSLFYPELRAMVMKTDGVALRVRRALVDLGGEIVLAVLYGPGLRADAGTPR